MLIQWPTLRVTSLPFLSLTVVSRFSLWLVSQYAVASM